MRSGRSCRSTACRNSSGSVRGGWAVMRGNSTRSGPEPELQPAGDLEVVEHLVADAGSEIVFAIRRGAELEVIPDVAPERDPVVDRMGESDGQRDHEARVAVSLLRIDDHETEARREQQSRRDLLRAPDEVVGGA